MGVAETAALMVEAVAGAAAAEMRIELKMNLL